MPLKREIIYPFFFECCQYADDVFWETIFEDLAHGKAPYGSYISKNCLCCSYKNKEFNYRIERKDPEILYKEIYQLLTEKLGILSQKEKAQKRVEFFEMEKNIKKTQKDWTSIRRKNVKDTLYEKYVIEMKKKHGLSQKECKYLLSVITLAITFRTITSKDIIFENDQIQSINGIDFEDGKIILSRPLCSNHKKIDSDDMVEEVIGTKLMKTHWESYLKYVKEKI